jgi:hypothetical protein
LKHGRRIDKREKLLGEHLARKRPQAGATATRHYYRNYFCHKACLNTNAY